METPIYLDYNATTPVDPAVVDAMLPYLTVQFGNASSTHHHGYIAQKALRSARTSVAGLLGARPEEIVFTGGGTESDNLAITGTVLSRLHMRPHVVSTTVEHPAVLSTLAYLRQRFDIEYDLVPVDKWGKVSIPAIEASITPATVLVSVMHSNNETGTIQAVRDIGQMTRSRGILFHVDAAQSVGKVPIDVNALSIDLLTIAGHKLYAPKGIGALYVRQGVELDPVLHGSGQEHALRAGTENVSSIVALAEAAQIAGEQLEPEMMRVRELRERLYDDLLTCIPGLLLNGHKHDRLPNTLNVSFPGVLGTAVLEATPGVAASTGSACHSSYADPSPVLAAMGMPKDRSASAVRLSLGRWTTADEIREAARLLVKGYRDASRIAGYGFDLPA